jgi:hypothetical protein
LNEDKVIDFKGIDIIGEEGGNGDFHLLSYLLRTLP